jgi:hypothetical protein
MKRFVTAMVLTFIAASAIAQPPPGPPPGDPPSPRGDDPRPRFLDMDGDGINDLAPDRDGDGLPDALDPMFRGPQARWRMKWYLMMPEAAKRDSAAFTEWWNGLGTPVPADRAWRRWRAAWFFSLPDSARQGPEEFRAWWLESRRPGNWERGWHAWRRWVEMGGPDMMDRRREFLERRNPRHHPRPGDRGSGRRRPM